MRPPRGSLGRAIALGHFTARTNVGRWVTRGGLVAGLAVMALGPVLSMGRGAGWQFDLEIAGMGFFIMALFALRSGYEEQRELELSTFLRRNLASRLEHGLGLVLALVATWAGLCALAFVAVLLLSGGSVDTAAWATGRWGLRLLLLAGFVPLVEAIATLRLPLILPTFVYAGLILTLTIILHEDRAIALFIPVAAGDMDALIRLTIVGVSTFALTSTLFVLLILAGPTARDRLIRIFPRRH